MNWMTPVSREFEDAIQLVCEYGGKQSFLTALSGVIILQQGAVAP